MGFTAIAFLFFVPGKAAIRQIALDFTGRLAVHMYLVYICRNRGGFESTEKSMGRQQQKNEMTCRGCTRGCDCFSRIVSGHEYFFFAVRTTFARRTESATFDSDEFLYVAPTVSYIQFTGFNDVISCQIARHCTILPSHARMSCIFRCPLRARIYFLIIFLFVYFFLSAQQIARGGCVLESRCATVGHGEEGSATLSVSYSYACT